MRNSQTQSRSHSPKPFKLLTELFEEGVKALQLSVLV